MQESLAEARRKLLSVEHAYHERKLSFAQQKNDLVFQYKYDRRLLKRGMSTLESLIQEMEVDAATAGHEGAEPPDEPSDRAEPFDTTVDEPFDDPSGGAEPFDEAAAPLDEPNDSAEPFDTAVCEPFDEPNDGAEPSEKAVCDPFDEPNDVCEPFDEPNDGAAPFDGPNAGAEPFNEPINDTELFDEPSDGAKPGDGAEPFDTVVYKPFDEPSDNVRLIMAARSKCAPETKKRRVCWRPTTCRSNAMHMPVLPRPPPCPPPGMSPHGRWF